MPASILQEIEGPTTVAGTVASATFGSNVTAGSAIHAIYYGTDVIQTNAMTGATFSLLDGPIVLGSIRLWHYAAYNVAGGATTITATQSVSGNGRSLFIREVGAVKVAPIDGHNFGSQSAPGTGTNAVTTSAAVNVGQPALLSAFALRCFFNTAVSANSTWLPGANASTGVAGAGGWASESLRVLTTGNQFGTFTLPANSGNIISVLAVFDELGVGAGQQMMMGVG